MITEKPLSAQAWRNIGFIRSLRDEEYARDLLVARRDFLRLRSRSELAIRQVYVRAADRIAEQLRDLRPTVGGLTRRHLMVLEQALRREADAIHDGVTRQVQGSMESAVALGARPIDRHLLRAIEEAHVPVDVLKLQRGFAEVNRAAVEALWARTHRGLRVSDRIWNTANDARTAMRDLVQAGVAMGRDPVRIARDLERYVRGGAVTLAGDYPNMLRRMGRWIPKNLSYEALRLARTETTKAFQEGVYSRGRTNPAYRGVKWMLSDAHPFPDVCDTLASADLYGMGRGVYPVGEEPVVPHPNCLCYVVAVLLDRELFVQDLLAWQSDPGSRAYLEEWYTQVRQQSGPVARVRGAVSPLLAIRGISPVAARAAEQVSEELRVLTVLDGRENAAIIHAETGREVAPRIRGTKTSVNLLSHVEAMVPGDFYVSLHTHPRSSSFSPQDAAFLVEREGIRALYVIGRDGTRYLLSKKPGAEPPTRESIMRIYRTQVDALMPKYQLRVQSGELSQQEAWKQHTHEVWLEIAERLNLVYERWSNTDGP